MTVEAVASRIDRSSRTPLLLDMELAGKLRLALALDVERATAAMQALLDAMKLLRDA